MKFGLPGDPLPISKHEAVGMAVGAVNEPGIDPAPYEARRIINLGWTRGNGAYGLALRADLFPAYVK